MSVDDPSDEDETDVEGSDVEGSNIEEDIETESRETEADCRDGRHVRDRLEDEADRAVEQFDEGLIDLLEWILDTETRARIYVHLRQHEDSTSEEVAEGTGLYPSTVRETLAELHDEGTVHRRKRESDGAGNNPYEYATISPSELVASVVEDVQHELNTVFNLDRILDGEEDGSDADPVTINVETESGVREGNGDVENDVEVSDDENEEE